jgi:carboxyl-terminal processing protease
MSRRNLIWFAALLAAALVTMWVAQQSPSPLVGGDADVRPLAKVYRLIQNNSYRRLDDQELCQLAIRGMSQVDDYSSYVPPGQEDAFADRVMGAEFGLGLRVESANGAVMVVGPVAGSPAHRAGIFGGDRLLSVDGREVAAMTPDAASALLNDPRKRAAELRIMHPTGQQELYRLERADIPLESVTGLFRDAAGRWVHRPLDDEQIVYIRIKEFTQDTVPSLVAAIRSLGAPRGVVLDLRDNPGGLLTAAVGVADLFLRQGVIVKKAGREGQPEVYRAHAEGTLDDLPLVVLINEQTASAAEIVAGSLKINGRAVLVGTRTLGKGTVQSMFKLDDNMGQINLTTGEYFLGDGRPISRRRGSGQWGVEPHVHSILMPGRQGALASLRLRGELMPRPLPATAPAAGAAEAATKAAAKAMLELDTQLTTAIGVCGDAQQMRMLREPTPAASGPGDAAEAAATTAPAKGRP